MKAIRTQFDAGAFSGAVATPTCSSCCCCCCCATTVVTAGIVGAVGSSRAAKRAGLSATQRVLAIIAAVIVPWLPVAAGAAVLSPLLSGENVIAVLPPGVMGVVAYVSYFGLFFWLRVRSPGARALAMTAVLGGAFVAEFIAGLWLIMASEGDVWLYLILATAATAGLVFLMLTLPNSLGRSATDTLFGLLPTHAAGPPPGYPPGGPPPGRSWPEP